jgi:CheY-like chemotaxis protein
MRPAHIIKRQILVVDDEGPIRRCIEMVLEMDGHVVSSVGSGEKALALFQLGRFDVIFTDFSMPSMTGDKLAATIKLLSPHQPIVILTGFSEKFEKSHRPRSGADLIIGKPFDIADLRRAVTLADRANSSRT